ncbi:MAG: permease [Pseudonocardiaceae bacterium]
MAQPSDVEARLAALEARMDVVAALEARMDIVAADAAAARHLAAARDRDLADLGVKVDANRAAINALGEQTAAGFAEMRGRLDAAAAGQQRIVDLLTGLISGQSDQQ